MTLYTDLRWEKQGDDAEWAYSGDIIVGVVVHQGVGERLWVYHVDGVKTKWTTKGHGRVATREYAKRAVNRAWSAWLERAGLRPI